MAPGAGASVFQRGSRAAPQEWVPCEEETEGTPALWGFERLCFLSPFSSFFSPPSFHVHGWEDSGVAPCLWSNPMD